MRFFLLVLFIAMPCMAQTLVDTWQWRLHVSDEWETLPANSFPQDWTGSGWFRVVLDTEGMSPSTDKVLLVGGVGDVVVYCDGLQISPLTNISAAIIKGESIFAPPHQIYKLQQLAVGQRHDIDVQFTGYSPDAMIREGLKHRFHISLASGTEYMARHTRLVRLVTRHEMFLFGFCLSFSIIHLLLFLYYPSLRANLFYSGFTASSACLGIVFLGAMVRVSTWEWLFTMRISTLVLTINQTMAILLVYSYLLPKPPRLFKAILLYFSIVVAWSLLQPFLAFEIQGSIILVAIGEMLRTLLTFRRKGGEPAVPGARILIYGGVPTFLALLYQLALFNFPGMPSLASYVEFPLLLYAPLPLMLSMSLLLSRFFAKTNRELELRLFEVQALNEDKLIQERNHLLLSAENERKNQELEEARKLQLSLLPKNIPELPGFHLGAYMKTAYEVGGDYYDFFPYEDKGLLVVIGDATGHGLRAGHMVVAAKSLLGAVCNLPSPGPILTKMGAGLKRMNFRGMFMTMGAVVIREDKVVLSVAGMPPVLHYHADTGEVVPISHGSLPLGVPVQYSYRDQVVVMNHGDALLLMSDGLPERFNDLGKMLGLDKVLSTFRTHAGKTPPEVIEALVAEGDAFGGSQPLDDDLTLLILKRD